MQTFSDKFMQLRQEALAVVTQLQRWHKNDFRMHEPINKTGDHRPDSDFKSASVLLSTRHDGTENEGDNIWPYAISKDRVYYVTIDGYKGVIDLHDLSLESLFALADWINEKHHI